MRKGKLSEKKGYTLLEVILVTALVGIFFTMAAGIVPTWYRAYMKTMELNHARQIADSIIGAIEENVRFANNVTVVPATADESGVERLCGKDGKGGSFCIPRKKDENEDETGTGIVNTGKNQIDGLAYDEKYFMKHDVQLAFVLAENKKNCKVTVTVTKKENGAERTVLTKERTIALYGEN